MLRGTGAAGNKVAFKGKSKFVGSGLEKKMKWIGLEWRKGGGIGEKSRPKLTSSRKHIKQIFEKYALFRKQTKTAGIPLSFG